MKTLIVNIGELVGIVPEGVMRKQGAEMSETGVLKDAWLRVEGELIKDFGSMADCPAHDGDVLDAEGGMVMPAFCDSHTHVVYAGSREGEFLDKINGLSYEEIAARGGGILNSADLLHRTPEDDRGIDWGNIFLASGFPAFEYVDVGQPEPIHEVEKILADT
ncbi:MAG: hypothetical protein IKX29_08360, partial [Bacteroidales bacterium]|nr:hypothetical protein [Bacteroidales bacterium]